MGDNSIIGTFESPSGSGHRRYEFKKCVGRGGFGEVYLAVQHSPAGVRSHVAVKVLHRDIDPAAQSLKRLRDEGRLLGLIDHPAILQVHDLVLINGRVALVTEYLDGADLHFCMRDSDPLPMRALIEAVGQVADALDAAHNTPGPDGQPIGLVHRDIKPANIRIGKHGAVKLLDFGIAKAKGERAADTKEQTVLGSMAYMGPERFDPHDPVTESDVYSLGCVLFEGIARRRLFHKLKAGHRVALAVSREKHDEYLAERLNNIPGIPIEVRTLLEEMLAFTVEERLTPSEVARKCEHLAELVTGSRLRAWCREHQWPDPEQAAGELEGKCITETTLYFDPHTGEVPVQPEPVGINIVAKAPPSNATKGAVAGAALMLFLGSAAWFSGLIHMSPQGPAPEPVAPVAVIVPDVGSDTETAAPEEPATETDSATAVVKAPPPPPKPVVASVKPPPKPSRPATGTVSIDGTYRLELRGASGKFGPGSVPAGQYDAWVDFGDGFTNTTPVKVSAGTKQTLRCKLLRRTCTVSEG